MSTYSQQDFASALKEFFQKKPNSLNEIADAMEIGRGHFSLILNGKKDIQVRTLLRISNAYPDIDWNYCLKGISSKLVTIKEGSHQLNESSAGYSNTNELELLRENRGLRKKVESLQLELDECQKSSPSRH